MSPAELREQLFELPDRDRADLAHDLLESLTPYDAKLDQAELERAQTNEAVRRWGEFQADPNAETFDSDEAVEEIRREIRR